MVNGLKSMFKEMGTVIKSIYWHKIIFGGKWQYTMFTNKILIMIFLKAYRQWDCEC